MTEHDRESGREVVAAVEGEGLASQRWLIVGAVGGLIVALAGVAQPRSDDGRLPSTAVATVNGEVVRAETLDLV